MATKQYDKKFTIRYNLKLNIKTDKDIIEYLNQIDNKQGLIKELIRKHLDNKKK